MRPPPDVSPGMGKLEVGAALREIAALLVLLGGNGFRAKAYATGARAIEGSDEEPAQLVQEGRLTELPGIGEGIASQIEALVASGASPVLERLRAEAPRGAAELVRIRGMSLKRMRALQEGLGIDSIASLREACDAGLVRSLRGFGERTERALAAGIAALAKEAEPASVQRSTILVDAMAVAEALVAYVRGCASVANAEIAGSVRRREEAVARVVVAAAADEPGAAFDEISKYPEASACRRGEDHVTLRITADLLAEAHVASRAHFPAKLVSLTGPPDHVAGLEARAAERCTSLATMRASDEREVYAHLGLTLVPPELRDDPAAIEAAARPGAFAELLSMEDIRGMVHCHTTYSDGRDTILTMAREAERLGMEYLTITDHSATAHYAGGLEVDRLQRQWDEIDEAQAQVKVKLLRGTESDILASGELDYPDRILEKLDVVIASIHARYRMDEAAMTERIVRAMKLPIFKIWGHPLGRLILHRAPIACRLEEILDVIARSPAAIEVNGDPYRLDLPPEWIRQARARGIPFVVSVDAHSTRGMRSLAFAVAMARRGGLTRREVVNTRDAAEFARRVCPTGAPACPAPRS